MALLGNLIWFVFGGVVMGIGWWLAGVLGIIGNVLWFVFLGWCLAIGHLVAALFCFITIIGIPFGLQHIKLARIALFPIGMTVVPIR